MIKLLEKIIKLRNPQFQFDNSVTISMLIELSLDKATCLFRGFLLLLRFKNPKFIMLGKGTKFQYISKIKWGKFVKIDDHVHLSGLAKGWLEIGDNVGIGAYSRIIVSTSYNNIGEYIKIGNNVGLGEFAYLGGAGGLEIGDECIIGQYLSCHPENHNYESNDLAIRFQGTTRKGIKIGRNCWIGSKVTVLDGVEIGDDCVIAAGAVVTKSMPANSVIGGVPAKVIKNRTEST